MTADGIAVLNNIKCTYLWYDVVHCQRFVSSLGVFFGRQCILQVLHYVKLIQCLFSVRKHFMQSGIKVAFLWFQANCVDSPISAIFRGQIRSILHQPGLKESATLQPFFTLQLDIHVSFTISHFDLP